MLIQNQTDLLAFCHSLREVPFITVDTEFLREKTYYPKLCLIQIGAPEGRAAAIDPLMEDIDLGPVFDIMADSRILKVFHAARQDLEIFYNLTGRVVEPFFDTQIAAMVYGYGDSIGYESLVRDLLGAQIDKSSQFTDWSNRPLSSRQIDYALGDVVHLVGVYQKLSAELDRRGRVSWVFEEEETLRNPSLYENSPQEAWERIKLRSPKPKTLAILRELAAWREVRAQEKDIPRSWVLKDETLADMAAQAPKTKEQLGKIRGVASGLVNGNSGQVILDLIAQTESSDSATWPRTERKPQLSPDVLAKAEILKLLLKVQCALNDVAAKLVISRDDIDVLAAEESPDLPVLRGWRFEVFGREALALKNGKIAMGFRDGSVHKYSIGS